MDPNAVIELRNVCFAYGAQPVLQDVSLTVQAGDFASVVGPNGGGKTTLLKLVLGLLEPDSGVVRVFGRAPREVRRRIGYMPQHARLDPQFPVTVLDVVLLGRLGAGLRLGPFRPADRLAALEALREVDMQDLRHRRFAALSGGQRQRVLIARALAGQPDLLLLDEPTSNLDPHVEGEFYELLRRLNDRMTILVVSHDLGFVSQLVRTVICVNRSVQAHPTGELTGDAVSRMYAHDVRMVMHDRH